MTSPSLPERASLARRIVIFPLTRLVIAVVVVVALQLGVSGIARGVGWSPSALARAAVGCATALATLAFLSLVVERRPLAEAGVPAHAKSGVRDLATGFGVGAALFSSVIGVLAIAGYYRVTGIAGGVSAVAYGLPLFFFVGVSEEVLFRGIFFRVVEDGLGSWAAIGLSAAAFGAVHLGNPNATWVAGTAIALEAGVLLAAMFMWRRSLPFCCGVHWAWNFVEGPVFGTAVSGTESASFFASKTEGPALLTGGEFGPEAGLVAVVLCAALASWVLVRAVRGGAAVPPRWRRRAGR